MKLTSLAVSVCAATIVFCCLGTRVQGEPPPPLGHWQLDGDTSNSGSVGDPDCVLLDGAVLTGANGGACNVGQAVTLNGEPEYVVLADVEYVGNVLEYNTLANFTWMAWVKTNGDGVILAKSPAAWAGSWDDVHGSKAMFIRGGKLTVDIGWIGAVQQDDTTPVKDGKWHHVAATFSFGLNPDDNDTVTLYVDGAPVGAKSDWDLNTQTDIEDESFVFDFFVELKAGFASSNFPNEDDSSQNYFNGQIDDIRFYEGALSVDNIAAIIADSACGQADDDSDGDGIADLIDHEPDSESNEFRYGELVGLRSPKPTECLVTAAPLGANIVFNYPDVQIPLACRDPAWVFFYYGSNPEIELREISPGTSFVAYPGSLGIEMLSGSCELHFTAQNGEEAILPLVAGDDVTVDPDTYLVTNNGSSAVVLQVGGEDIPIQPGGTADLSDPELDSDGDGIADLIDDDGAGPGHFHNGLFWGRTEFQPPECLVTAIPSQSEKILFELPASVECIEAWAIFWANAVDVAMSPGASFLASLGSLRLEMLSGLCEVHFTAQNGGEAILPLVAGDDVTIDKLRYVVTNNGSSTLILQFGGEDIPIQPGGTADVSEPITLPLLLLADAGDCGPLEAGWTPIPDCGTFPDLGGSGFDVTLEVTGCDCRNAGPGGSGVLPDVEADLLFGNDSDIPDADIILTLGNLVVGEEYFVVSYHNRHGDSRPPIAEVQVTGATVISKPSTIDQNADIMAYPPRVHFTADTPVVSIRYVAAAREGAYFNGFELYGGAPSADIGPFIRGDCNGNGASEGDAVSDAVAILDFNFIGDFTPPCIAACNANGDKFLDVSDAIYLLEAGFTGGDPPPAPFPNPATSTHADDIALGCDTPLAP